jgi:hypothetical protein
MSCVLVFLCSGSRKAMAGDREGQTCRNVVRGIAGRGQRRCAGPGEAGCPALYASCPVHMEGRRTDADAVQQSVHKTADPRRGAICPARVDDRCCAGAEVSLTA